MPFLLFQVSDTSGTFFCFLIELNLANFRVLFILFTGYGYDKTFDGSPEVRNVESLLQPVAALAVIIVVL